MVAVYLVTMGHGPSWEAGRSRRQQPGFTAHAAHLDALVAAGRVLLGGPAGDDVDTGDALLLVRADGVRDARRVFDDDPWLGSILTLTSVARWTLWLGPREWIDEHEVGTEQCACEPDLDDHLFARTCDYCGTAFAGARCPHDPRQQPCPECDVVPVPQLG
jgi:uncharacterized protein YciI